jgi:hypothetical protein
MTETAEQQIKRLADWLTENTFAPNVLRQGAVTAAINKIEELQAEIDDLKAEVDPPDHGDGCDPGTNCFPDQPCTEDDDV